MKFVILLSILGLVTLSTEARDQNTNRYKLFKVETIEELEQREQEAIQREQTHQQAPFESQGNAKGTKEAVQKHAENNEVKKVKEPKFDQPVESTDLNDSPLFGILTQPMHKDQPSRLHEEKTEYVLQEHVKFLEAAGARVVPVSFLLLKNDLFTLLSKLNGIYVPGDNANVMDNDDYALTVKAVQKFAQEQNEAYNSFPVVFTQWSFLLMMQQNSRKEKALTTSVPNLYLSSREVSQKVDWQDSFILNESQPLERSHLYSELQQPFLMSKAVLVESLDRTLTDQFFMVSSFEVEEQEFVAMLEGKRAPVFGLAYSPQKSQFTTEPHAHVDVASSMQARYHAQFLANYFVDTARENSNRCKNFEEEQRILINRFPSVFVEEKVGEAANRQGLKFKKGLNRQDLTHTQSLYALSYSELRF